MFGFFFRINRRVKRYRRITYKITNLLEDPDYNQSLNKKQAISEAELKSSVDDLPLAHVRKVLDGDTVVVNMHGRLIKIRLDSIDCPEDGQEWGDNAKYGLIKLIGGKTISLEEHGIDHHGRLLATIYVQDADKGNWINVNEKMVAKGHAWVMRLFYDHLPKDRQNKLNNMEKWAKSKNIGLWRQENPVPPWQWRKGF